MASYPDWALKYKKKGYYLNKYKDHYRLYKGHCEYRDGKSVRVVDYYCGTITEKDGLIPSQGLIKGEINVYEYGFYYFLYLLFFNIYSGQNKIQKKYADTIMVTAICKAFSISPYKLPYTSLLLLYSKYNAKYLKNETIVSEIDRVSTMMNTEFNNKCAHIEGLKDILSTLSLVLVNKRYQLSTYDKKVDEIFKTFNFEVKIYGEN